MKVKNLVVWAGGDFAYAPGDIIDLPEATVKARIAAGLCEAVAQPKPEVKPQAKPEVKPEAKPEVKPEAKHDEKEAK